MQPHDIVGKIVDEIGPVVGLNGVVLAGIRAQAVNGAKRDEEATRRALYALEALLEDMLGCADIHGGEAKV